MEPFIWSKVLDFSGNTIMKTLSLVFKILVIVGLPVLVIYWAYGAILKPYLNPNPTNRQMGERDNYQYTIEPKSYFGCQSMRVIQSELAKPIKVKK